MPQTSVAQSEIDEYLSTIDLTRLSSIAQASLDTPISVEELEVMLKSMKEGKAPGPDGYTMRYYKEFVSVLGSRMAGVFNEMGQTAAFPPEALLAHITVIPKEGEGPGGVRQL